MEEGAGSGGGGQWKEGVTGRRAMRNNIYSQPSNPRDSAYQGFNRGTCGDNTSHPTELHVCRYCLNTLQCIFYHTEKYCGRKGLSKYGAEGLGSTTPGDNKITGYNLISELDTRVKMDSVP